MDKDELLRLADDPNLIPGIYNYCDRWCERCAFTRRCLTFLSDEQSKTEGKESGDDMDAALESVAESVRLTGELLADSAEELGIDLDNLPPPDPVHTHRRRSAREHRIAKEAVRYGARGMKWFEEQRGLIEAKETELRRSEELGIGDPLVDAAEILDASEVIRWYLLFIGAKVTRALGGKDEDAEMDQDEEVKDSPKDSDGSAKIALIAMDRSIEAWKRLEQHFEDEGGSIQSLCDSLVSMRSALEAEFPNARGFVRPGFDQDIGWKL